MGLIVRSILLILIVVAVFCGVLAWKLLEFGPRPDSASAPLPIDPRVKFIEANGIQFGYLEEGTGPLILLLHGYPETARSWGRVQQTLAAAGYRVVAPFTRGYPPTEPAPDADYSLATLGADVIALIDAFGEESAVIIGHDWGASAVYRAALSQPEKVDAMVALAIPHPVAIAGDPSVLLGASHFIYYQLPIASRLMWSNDFAHIDWIYRQWSPTYEPPASEMDDIKAALRAPGGIEGTLGYYWSYFAPKDGPQLDPATKVTVPALVIAGSADGTLDLSRFEAGAVGFANRYELVVIDGVGHFPQLEAPDEVAQAILGFLSPPG